MRALRYALGQGWTSLWRARGSTIVAVAAIALTLLVLGSLLLVTWNAERLLAGVASTAEFSVYLHDDAEPEERAAIEALLAGAGVAERIEFVSKEEALATFRTRFSDLAPITGTLGRNPFPASFEVQVAADADHERAVEPLVRRVSSLPGVSDVRYDREWLRAVESMLATLRTAGLVLALLMGLAAAVTVAAVVRLGLLARTDEIEIMELVGAPHTFIRGPFIAEGVFQGGLGGVVALAGLWVIFAVVQGTWGDGLTMPAGGRLEFLPVRVWLYLLAGGTLVGSLGGLAAARHAGSSSGAPR